MTEEKLTDEMCRWMLSPEGRAKYLKIEKFFYENDLPFEANREEIADSFWRTYARRKFSKTNQTNRSETV